MSSEAERATLARGLLITQTRKEFAEQVRQYQVGFVVDGQIIVRKTTDAEHWSGVLLLIPHETYLELFGGK